MQNWTHFLHANSTQKTKEYFMFSFMHSDWICQLIWNTLIRNDWVNSKEVNDTKLTMFENKQTLLIGKLQMIFLQYSRYLVNWYALISFTLCVTKLSIEQYHLIQFQLEILIHTLGYWKGSIFGMHFIWMKKHKNSIWINMYS